MRYIFADIHTVGRREREREREKERESHSLYMRVAKEWILKK
jgi:hypothetical protein